MYLMVAHCTKACPVCGADIASGGWWLIKKWLLVVLSGSLLVTLWLPAVLMASDSVNESAGAKDMLINCTSPRGQVDADFTAEVMNPVLIKHGYKPIFLVGQGPAIIEQLRQGSLAGDCGRIEAFNESAGLELIRIEPAIRRVKFAIWAYDADLELRSRPQDDVRLGYLATTQAAPQLAEQMGFTNLRSYDSMELLAEALQKGELDAMLNYQALVSGYNRKTGKQLYRIRHIVTFPVYIYLQPEYKHLIPSLSHAIKVRSEYRPYEPVVDKEIPPLADDRIIFGCSIPSFSQAFSELETLYRGAFNALGYEFQMFSLPRARERAELLGGKLDGTCARADVEPYKSFRSLLKLQPPITEMALKVYSRQPMKVITNLDQLPSGSTIAYVRGTTLARLILQRSPRLHPKDVTSAAIGIKMLAAGRVDYFLGLSSVSDYVLGKLDIRQMLFVVSDLPPIYLYPYINTRHNALHKPLQNYIREYRAERSQQVVLPYLPGLIDEDVPRQWEGNP
jgi:ABC-type amino acid transport substrate-binding protein